MEAIKAMVAILLAAAVEFAVVVIYNSKTIPAYEAKIVQANQTGAAEILKRAAANEPSQTPGAAAQRKNKDSNL